MLKVLDKNTIEMEKVSLIPPPTGPLVEIINATLYKLKTGVQWHQLPVKALFEDNALTWNAFYYHYGEWCLFKTICY